MLEPGPTQQSVSRSKRKIAGHKPEEKEESARVVPRHCADCYEKIRQQ